MNTTPVRAAIVLLALILIAPSSQNRGGSLINSLAGLIVSTASAADDAPIDFDRAKQYQRKKQSGGTLTADEEAYMRKAIQEYQKQNGGKNKKGNAAPPSTTPVSDPEIVKALVPIDELSAPYKGQDGGLYGGGHNAPPAAHLAAYLKESSRIEPLDADGKPSKSGKIVMVSIGMSNTTMEYSKFKSVADKDPQKSPYVVIVDGAQGGKTGITWAADGRALLPAEENARVAKVLGSMSPPRKPEAVNGIWTTVEDRLKAAEVTPQQVQAVWIKHAEARPKGLGEFPEHAQVLEADIIDTLLIAKKRYPNLRVAYLSSRIFGGYATTDLNPEPYAYEEGFSMRWVIQDQIKGDPRLNYDSSKGEVKAPIVLWGPYLWANGTTPRKTDGFAWAPGDFVAKDHTHPDESAKEKVTNLLLNFLKKDQGASKWFVAGAK